MKAKEVHQLSTTEIEKKLRDTRKELLELRLKKETGQVENPAALRTLRRDIARFETVLRAKSAAA